MNLGHIELFVSDPMRAKDFYTSVLGFELIVVQAGKFVWVESGSMQILLRPGGGRDAPTKYNDARMGLVLYAEDFEHVVQQLTARGLKFQGNDGSPRCLTFTDPDGHWFQLVSPADY